MLSMNCHMNESSVFFQISTLDVWNSDEVVTTREWINGDRIQFCMNCPFKNKPPSLSLALSFSLKWEIKSQWQRLILGRAKIQLAPGCDPRTPVNEFNPPVISLSLSLSLSLSVLDTSEVFVTSALISVNSSDTLSDKFRACHNSLNSSALSFIHTLSLSLSALWAIFTNFLEEFWL